MLVNAGLQYPLKGMYNDTPFRIDESLEKIETGKSCKETFEQKHGTLVVLHPNKGEKQKFIVKPGDDVRVSCSAGWCRSQVTYLIFELFDGIINRNPHGARDYFDRSQAMLSGTKILKKKTTSMSLNSALVYKKQRGLATKSFRI